MAALTYQLSTVAVGSLILLLGIAGLLLVLFHMNPRPASPLVYPAGITAMYKLLQDLLLAYQVNYLTNVYPLWLPFVAISVTALADGVRRRSRRRVFAQIA